MIWVAGQLVANESLTISVLDRVFEHGLGLFESMRTWNRHPTLLHRHRARLMASARELGLALDPRHLPNEEDVSDLCAAQRIEGDALLRITCSGGRDDDDPPRVWMRATPAPASFPEPWSLHGGDSEGSFAAHATDPDQLAWAKTLNYWVRRLAHQEAQEVGCDEALLFTRDGQVLEGSRTNLFAVIDDRVVTPPARLYAANDNEDDTTTLLDSRRSILTGIMRGLLLERAVAMGWDAHESDLSLSQLARASEVFLTNAVRGVIPVHRWGQTHYNAPGDWTRLIAHDLHRWLLDPGNMP